MRISVGVVLMSFVLAMVVGISGVIAPGGGAALGASTTLTIIGGDVQVSRQGAPFAAATDGAVLAPGDIIRTAADARAVLTYFEGSTVSIEPSSELAIDQAHAAPDGSTVVVMTQNLGRTWHVVTKLIAGGSKYEVRTPAATASVRGTAFEVGVIRQADGQTRTAIVTTEGAVAAAVPATAAEPEPEPVVVPAGFQTTARSSERRPETPTLAPEPARKVTVTVSNENSVVVDPLGRSNGVKDGKLVLQTPGAQVVRTDGRLTITLPDVPDGKLSTVVSRSTDAPSTNANSSSAIPAAPPVQVVTTVEERGKAPAVVTETVRPDAQPATAGVHVKKSGPDPEATPDVRRVTEDEKKDLPAPKTVVEPEKADETQAPVFRPGLGADPKVIQRIVEERRAIAEERPATATEPEAQKQADAPAKGEDRTAAGPGFVPQINFHGAPNAASQQREDAKKEEQRNEDDKKAATETKKDASDIKATEQLQKAAQVAEQVATVARSKAGDEARKAAEEKARAERSAREAEAARLKAERERREAEERATKAASEAARRAAAEEARARAVEQERAEQQKRAAERAAREAEAEAREQARQLEKARQAEQAARELRERLQKQLLELQRRQQSASDDASSGNDAD